MRSQWIWLSSTRSHLNVRDPVRKWQNPCCPVKQHRLLMTCQDTKRGRSQSEGIFLFMHLCVGGLCCFLWKFLIFYKPSIFSHHLISHSVISTTMIKLLFKCIYMTAFLKKKMMYYIYNKLLYIE